MATCRFRTGSDYFECCGIIQDHHMISVTLLNKHDLTLTYVHPKIARVLTISTAADVYSDMASHLWRPWSDQSRYGMVTWSRLWRSPNMPNSKTFIVPGQYIFHSDSAHCYLFWYWRRNIPALGSIPYLLACWHVSRHGICCAGQTICIAVSELISST